MELISDIVKSQMYWNGKAFEMECPICFGRCYCYSDDNIVCEEHLGHRFSLLSMGIAVGKDLEASFYMRRKSE